MPTYEITCDLPPIECSSNWHGHWAKKGSAVKAYREQCAWQFAAAVQEQRIPCPLPFVTVHLDFYQAPIRGDRTRTISRDTFNAIDSVKSLIDALQDAKLVTTDSRKHVGMGAVRLFNVKKEHQGRRCVVVRLEVADTVD